MKPKLFLFLLIIFGLMQLPGIAETVIYNPNTKIYHNQYCASAARCKICKKVEKTQAIRSGARACKKCGG